MVVVREHSEARVRRLLVPHTHSLIALLPGYTKTILGIVRNWLRYVLEQEAFHLPIRVRNIRNSRWKEPPANDVPTFQPQPRNQLAGNNINHNPGAAAPNNTLVSAGEGRL